MKYPRWQYAVVAVALIIGVVSGLLVRAYNRPLPALSPVTRAAGTQVLTTPEMLWSPYGEQALMVVGHPGLSLTHGDQNPLPTASIAKVVTALAILKQKPLKPGEHGPLIPVSASEVQVYERDLAQNQSVVKVTAGEQLSEYQALQAMLVPSATNIADIAAPWAFGSMDNYLTFANAYAKELGLTQTHIADASGFSPLTTSTPQDLLKLGEAALKNPVIAEIVAQKEVTLPVAGTVKNFNIDLGISSIDGIKTGNTDEAGGALLFSAQYQNLTIIGAIMGAPDLGTALHDAPEVLDSYKQNIEVVTVVHEGEVVGHYDLPWGGSVNAIAQKDLLVAVWRGTKLPLQVKLDPIMTNHSAGKPVGTVSITTAGIPETVPVVLEHTPTKPSFWWRLTRH